MRRYEKKPLTYSEQVDLLQQRGLLISDIPRAQRYLGEISYYRLSAYFLPFCIQKDCFNPGTTFENILNTYLFDRELRLLVFDAIERIEIAIRTQMIYKLAHKYNDSHWQDRQNLFVPRSINQHTGKPIDIYNDTQAIIKEHIADRNPEIFIKHYVSTYDNPPNPACWMTMELLTIGELSRLFRALKDNSDKKLIADFFGLHHTVFVSWLHSLVYVRNICAHHARLWNRDFAIKPAVLKQASLPWIGDVFNPNNRRCFYFLSIIKYLLIKANPSNTFAKKMNALFAKYPDVPIRYIGIPTDKRGHLIDWAEEPLWQH